MAPGIQFDADMSQVQSLTRLEKDSAELAALRKQARQLGADTMFSATEAAQGQGFLAMAGFGPQAILEAMPGLLDMAKAGGNELAETADIASNILTGFGIPADQMGRVGDVLVGAFTRSNTNLAMLGETMKYAAPIASSLGQDIETVAAMAGKLGDAGIQGGMGGTALRSILNRLSAPPKAAANALDTLGISASTADGNLRPMPELLKEIYERTKKMGDTERAGLLKGLAGEEAVSAMQVLVKQAGSGELQAFIGTLRETQGEAAKTAKIMGDNLVGDLDELSSAWEDLGIQLQEQQNGPMRETVVMLADIVGAVKDWMVANPELTSTLVKVAAVMALVIAAGGAITIGLASIIGPLAMLRYGMAILSIRGGGLARIFTALGRTALPLVGKGLLFIGRALMMNPIGLAVAAIATAAYLIYRYWEPIKAFFSDLWVEVKTAFAGGVASVAALILNWSPVGLFYQAFAAAMNYLGVELPGKFTEFGSMLVSGLIAGIRNMGSAVKDTVTGLGSDVMGWFKEKLGINSPSRVFVGFGENISEGAAQGISRSQTLAERAATALAAGVVAAGAMSPALAQSLPPINFDTRPSITSQVSGGRALGANAPANITVEGDRVEIHIHAAPGMNAQDIGRAVAAELDRREREKLARARSALADYGN
ncbi:phage tail tape measure protein [Paracandidimonas soli]